ncbi:uncharacterized protein LOC126695903 [Quercus robur]|uniref:uncharacterized protein LOC126695903 n=1 Tax=Quercus robur TaxID=38942 RepID=UPI002163BE2F|nr:uncharacterized protein LOC126695903 [Quercus robur]
MGKARENSGYMALKIDLEKAYDKLEWRFIKGMLSRYNFPDNLIELIMSCIYSVSTSLLFNGSLEPFWPSRGISLKEWPAFSHLLFADNLVLFAEANAKNCIAVREVLDHFCNLSGQTMSDAKSRVYFSPNIDQYSKEAFSDILGFHQTECLGKYLGFPIKHQGGNNQDFGFMVDRVKSKLEGWKANLLIQASISAIPTYVMQSNFLPNKVLEGIDRVNRNFLWGSAENKRKMHWIGWKKVTRPKEEGGLGLQTAKGRNTTILAKLNWRFHTEDKAP